ncbi:MAG: putative metallopeptidase [Patescibacteria group bacterium]
MQRKKGEMVWDPAPDIHTELTYLVERLKFEYIDARRLVCFRSFGSTSRARARIWSLPKVWQLALKVEAHYVVEVLSEKFDHLSQDDQKRVLIHELMHIPKSFSGALVPHRGRYHAIDHHTVERLFRQYLMNK